jgi:hypothetical protein
MTRDRFGMVWAGLGLIGLGLAVLAASLVGWARLWPLFPILAGLGLFAGYVTSGARDGGLAFLGTLATLSGLFLFAFTLGAWTWEEMTTLWPAFLVIAGIALLVAFLAERRSRDLGVLGLSCATMIAGVLGLGVTRGFVESDIVKLWPLLLVLVGLFSLAGVLFRALRRE